MKKSRFTESQIVSILKQAEAGTPVADLCREYGMSSASFYQWRSKYGGMDASLMRRSQSKNSKTTQFQYSIKLLCTSVTSISNETTAVECGKAAYLEIYANLQ